MNIRKMGIGRYIIALIVLLIAYYLIITFPEKASTSRRRQREVEVSENIRALQQSTNELMEVVQEDKDAINEFFFNPKTEEKLRGLLNAYPTDRDLKINDNLTITLQKEGNPIKIRLFNEEVEVINANFRQSEDTEGMTLVNDVKIVENPEDLNHYEIIHYLRMYLVDTYGQNAFNSYLDKTIEDQIKDNEETLEWFKKNYMDVEALRRRK